MRIHRAQSAVFIEGFLVDDQHPFVRFRGMLYFIAFCFACTATPAHLPNAKEVS